MKSGPVAPLSWSITGPPAAATTVKIEGSCAAPKEKPWVSLGYPAFPGSSSRVKEASKLATPVDCEKPTAWSTALRMKPEGVRVTIAPVGITPTAVPESVEMTASTGGDPSDSEKSSGEITVPEVVLKTPGNDS